MSHQAQEYLIEEITKAMNYCVDEYDITWAEAIGCMQLAIHKFSEIAVRETLGETTEEQ